MRQQKINWSNSFAKFPKLWLFLIIKNKTFFFRLIKKNRQEIECFKIKLIKSCQKSMRLSDYFLTIGLVSYFFWAVLELPKSPNQSPSNPVDFFSYFFFGYLSSRLKSLKKLKTYKKKYSKLEFYPFLGFELTLILIF